MSYGGAVSYIGGCGDVVIQTRLSPANAIIKIEMLTRSVRMIMIDVII